VLNSIIEAWITKYTPEEVISLMQKAGVAAGAAVNSRGQTEDPR
jgi:crotonobetainyl-CoA:carnitine CoA-transferase CaiB-like acyl-CoA transferase